MVYVFLADGFEEVEAVTPIDYLRRADIEVITVGVTGKTVTGAHNISVLCDISVDEIDISKADGIILPGGMPGTLNLENSAEVQSSIDYCNKNGLLIAAICAAPSVLGHKNILQGKKAVCFPGFESELHGADVTSDFAVTDGNIITAKGAGSASEFAFEIIKYFRDEQTALQIKSVVQTCY
ncbi:MAG: DJ-1/PfpI family protein [Clostridia bacterium]|nr:DJ-1/PfpI family protein [Clostridia bacterium]